MASAEGDHEYDFIIEAAKDFVCVACNLTLNDPIQIANCGHCICKSCFNQLKAHEKRRYFLVTQYYNFMILHYYKC